ncbi:hypothetical protein D9757_000940 [Collybiopsis confluens]|uniref:Uncharacterized protein n=1 Tax=Collybiopsis confluens TaxID=2823264 RepID=A0A8H5I0G1_9AGAR|nr:hypothetical protein D9757_000940 [Collybiopsis confluens]
MKMFDPLRFYKMRERGGDRLKYQMFSTDLHFFDVRVAAEFVLGTTYDIKFEDGKILINGSDRA